ncbi:MAG TPA: hypothetical protein VFN77_03185, partial [Acetobacteraceae bacterium]|nr:hypothetical protein [Acetobacteraceae bacterium]
GQGMQGGGTAEGSSGPGSLGSGRTGETGTDREGHIDLKPGDAASPAQVIERELIRRDASPALPPPAHDYYQRLLGHQFLGHQY